MSAPDPKAVEAGISWLTSQKTRWGDLQQHQAVTIADALIAAARAYLRAPTAPQGAEIARDAARYRWLRDSQALFWKPAGYDSLPYGRWDADDIPAGPSLDAAIDAALTPTDAETKE